MKPSSTTEQFVVEMFICHLLPLPRPAPRDEKKGFGPKSKGLVELGPNGPDASTRLWLEGKGPSAWVDVAPLEPISGDGETQLDLLRDNILGSSKACLLVVP